MKLVCRQAAVLRATLCGVLVLCGRFVATAQAQVQIFPNQFELSAAVHLDEVDSSVRSHLERVNAYLADQQWDEAVETLRQVLENHGGKVIAISPARYVNLADYCHRQIAALPPEALELYRRRIDPQADRWYAEATADRNAALLNNIVQQMFCSNAGDEALLALGDMALQEGRPSIARSYWERLVPLPPERVPVATFEQVAKDETLPAEERQLVNSWYRLDATAKPPVYRLRHDEPWTDDTAGRIARFWLTAGLPGTRLAYPDSQLDRAGIRARLILASIFEGALDRAKSELVAFEQLHPSAVGTLAGRKEPYGVALARLIDEAQRWPAQRASDDWPTFAGNPPRNKIARAGVDVGAELWPAIPLSEVRMADSFLAKKFGSHRIAEGGDKLLSYHPLIVGNLVLYCNQSQVFALDLRTGKPAWPTDRQLDAGEIYRDALGDTVTGRPVHGLGVPRFSMTAYAGKLYARMGSQVTTRPVDSFEGHTSSLVCLDLNAQGRLLWKITPDDEKWAFEGAPLVEGSDVYVAMRKDDVRPQSQVACFDAETGRRRWRTMIVSAETAAGGQSDEMTHNLLTLDQGVVYANTNLGAVGAVSARDGRTLWISTYPRAKRSSSSEQDRRAAHFYRDLNPAIYYQGTLLVAPSDCESILAFDATSGQMKWETHLAADTVHLLGVGNGNLLASGDRLWWIDLAGGRVLARWPERGPPGYGRGILAGDWIYWPTRDWLYVFQQRVSQTGQPSLVRDPIPLTEGRGAGGGNLVIGPNVLLIAAADRLYAFGSLSGRWPQPVTGKDRPNPKATPRLRSP